MIQPMSKCPLGGPAESLRDYAFDELPQNERAAVEQHVAACGECALELDRLRMTTAALRMLPEQEIPQRIAFVSDRIFEPSWWQRFRNNGAQMGFASACVLALAIVVSAWQFGGTGRTEVRTVVQTAPVPQRQIDAAVAKAVAQARVEDMQVIQAAEQKREAEYRDQMKAISEDLEVVQARLNRTYMSLASNEMPGSGAGQ